MTDNGIDRSDVEQRVRAVFADLFGVDPAALNNDSSPDDVPNWDSLQHLNLVSTLEEEFGIFLADEDVIQMLSFGLVVDVVASAGTGS